MTARTVVHRLLSEALAEIRDGAANEATGVRRMAALFADLPPRLEDVARGDNTYHDVLAWLRGQAATSGLGEWLDTLIQQETRGSGDPGAQLHFLLYWIFITIRYEAHEASDWATFRLADLFHNVPLKLNSVLQGTWTYDEILASLPEHAERNGSAAWLDRALPDATGVVAR